MKMKNIKKRKTNEYSLVRKPRFGFFVLANGSKFKFMPYSFFFFLLLLFFFFFIFFIFFVSSCSMFVVCGWSSCTRYSTFVTLMWYPHSNLPAGKFEFFHFFFSHKFSYASYFSQLFQFSSYFHLFFFFPFHFEFFFPLTFFPNFLFIFYFSISLLVGTRFLFTQNYIKWKCKFFAPT